MEAKTYTTAVYSVEIGAKIIDITANSRDDAITYVVSENKNLTRDDVAVVAVEEFDVPEEYAIVRFTPQRKNRAGFISTADSDYGEMKFLVPAADATDDNGNSLPMDSFDSDVLRHHERAPQWITDWSGPFYVTVLEHTLASSSA